LVDGDVVAFDSTAILLYLAGEIVASSRRTMLAQNVVMVDTRRRHGPTRQAVHFKHFAPELQGRRRQPLAEAERHWGLIDFSYKTAMLGDTYTLVRIVWVSALCRSSGRRRLTKLPNAARSMNHVPPIQRAERSKPLQLMETSDARKQIPHRRAPDELSTS
jgi:glutathione S-transferase